MKMEIKQVTPAMAAAWLAAQPANRRISRQFVRGLRRMIATGKWQLNHQGIAFDESGMLVDGQHRLTAIAEEGVAVPVMCTFGVSREVAIASVDQGARRTMAQLAGMQGEDNASLKSSICRVIGVASLGLAISDRFDPQDFELVLMEYRAEVEQVIKAKTNPWMTSPILGALALTLRATYGETFYAGVTSGIGLAEGDARLVLRNVMQGAGMRKVRSIVMADRLLRTVCAAHQFNVGQPIQKLMISSRRYGEWCDQVKVKINPHLMTYAESANGK